LINPLLASIVGLVVISAVVVVVVVAVAKYCIQRRRRSKVARFGEYSTSAVLECDGQTDRQNSESLGDFSCFLCYLSFPATFRVFQKKTHKV